MRRLSLFFALAFVTASAQAESTSKLTELALQRNWQELIVQSDRSAQTLSAFEKLLRQKALVEQQSWQKLNQEPAIDDKFFRSYSLYLKAYSYFQSKTFEDLLKIELLKDLPAPLVEEISRLQAQAHLELGQKVEAKQSLKKFIKNYPNSHSLSDVLLDLANLEWELDNKHEAIAYYKKIYEDHPLFDANDVARSRLKKTGDFEKIDTAVHLNRIQQFKRAARFSKAIKELGQLKSYVEDKDKEEIDLAIAQLEFSRKNYSQTELTAAKMIASKAFKATYPELWLRWKRLHAFALTRQGKFEEAIKEYQALLSLDISEWEKEQFLLRMGLMALDDEDFEKSAIFFEQLRQEAPRGRYLESAHWFGAWSLYQAEKSKKQKNEDTHKNHERLKEALHLLEKLPTLPEGKNLSAQALFWRAEILKDMGHQRDAQSLRMQIQKQWPASFHRLLLADRNLNFLNYNENYLIPELIRGPQKQFRLADPAFQQISWKRLEAFASANFHQWAEYELDLFLHQTGRKNEGLKTAVANRLVQLEDWHDLIRYASDQFSFDLENFRTEDDQAPLFFPQAYHRYVVDSAREFKVSPFLIWAVMREESRFQADVVSWAGAVGLLQLMPNLGKRIARKLNESGGGREDLTQAKRNVRYGTFHLKELIDEVAAWEIPPHFVYPLVVASYNAGTAPVKRWLREIETRELGVFIESIPFSETRAYVKRVLQSANVYHLLYGEPIKHIAENSQKEYSQ